MIRNNWTVVLLLQRLMKPLRVGKNVASPDAWPTSARVLASGSASVLTLYRAKRMAMVISAINVRSTAAPLRM